MDIGGCNGGRYVVKNENPTLPANRQVDMKDDSHPNVTRHEIFSFCDDCDGA